MKLYATTTSERASKGQGGNKELSVCLSIGDKNEPKDALIIRAVVLPPEASISNLESVVISVWNNEQGELCDRLVYSLPSKTLIKDRMHAYGLGEQATKGKKKKGKKIYPQTEGHSINCTCPDCCSIS